VSPELRLIAAPRDTYASLARAPVTPSMAVALRRPALVALIIGISVAIAATGRASPALVLSTTLTWSYVVVLQLAVALAMIAPRAGRGIGVARALDLFFAGHAPWSIFILLGAAVMSLPLGWSQWPLEALAVVPAVLTWRIVRAFFAEVLGMDRQAARRAAVVHQAVTWATFVAVNWVASAFVPRLLEWL
jgi:hypothetical protein